jgi:two-component system NarL family sensor kinase
MVRNVSALDSEAVSTPRATLLAWSSWILSMVLTALTLLLVSMNDPATFLDRSFEALVLLVFVTVGMLIASRRPENLIGWMFCVGSLFWAAGIFALEYAVYALLTHPGALPSGEWMAVLGSWAQGFGYLLMISFLLLLFPTGKLPSPHWRPVAWLAAGNLACYSIVAVFDPTNLDVRLASVHNPLGIENARAAFHLLTPASFLVEAITLAACAVAVIARFRRAQGEERQQLKWFVYAAIWGVIGFGLLVGGFFFHIVWGSGLPFVLAVAPFPVAIGVAILRYHLYDIDILINRTLVYAALTVSVVGTYVLVVGSLGLLFQARGNLLLGVLATGLVAVLFHPLRDRFQRGVNRLMYGERDEPYAVISRLGQRLEATLAPDAVLPTIVQTVKDALKLPYVAIALTQDDSLVIAAAAGTARDESLMLPLVYQHESVGQLILAPRSTGESFSPADHRLLDDLARQAGVAAHAVQLTAELQHSRQRLVTTREEERRRLRRDLHDGLGPTLASLSMKLDAAQTLVLDDPPVGVALLAEIQAELKATIGNVRRVVYALRPPVLDQFGLVGAIREHALRATQGDGLRVVVEAPAYLPALPAAIEVATYYIAVAAITNVVEHACAHHCTVRLTVADALQLEIVDDGCGIPAHVHFGVGLHSMHERTAELGGTCVIEAAHPSGTRIWARLPLAKE